MELPDLLLKAIESACSTRRQLSWKIQEGPKGTLIQLVWKPNAVNTGNASEVVGTNSVSYTHLTLPTILLV